MVHVKYSKETLGQQARQLAVIQEAYLVDSQSFVIASTAQILKDVLKVWKANFHLEVIALGGLGKRE